MFVNIAGLDKVLLLKALWENSKPAVFFAMSGLPPPEFDQNEASNAVKKYIDYFQGRMIKSDLSKDEVDPSVYDRDYGTGTFQRIVNRLQ